MGDLPVHPKLTRGRESFEVTRKQHATVERDVLEG